MSNTNDQTGGMGRLSKKTREKVDKELKEQEVMLLNDTKVDLGSLRPQVSDPEFLDKLIEAVNASTQHNESVAELRQRITALGSGVVKVAKEVGDILLRKA